MHIYPVLLLILKLVLRYQVNKQWALPYDARDHSGAYNPPGGYRYTFPISFNMTYPFIWGSTTDEWISFPGDSNNDFNYLIRHDTFRVRVMALGK